MLSFADQERKKKNFYFLSLLSFDNLLLDFGCKKQNTKKELVVLSLSLLA